MGQPIVDGRTGALAPVWVQWVAGHALRGVADDALVDALSAAGMGRLQAERSVRDLLSHPILAAAQQQNRREDALQRLARLLQTVGPTQLPTVSSLDDATLYERFWTSHRPVIYRGAASSWPSADWTFETLRARYAFAPMDVLKRPARWWLHDRECRRMAFGDFLDVVLGPASDALYADGRCQVLEQAGLVSLREGLGLLPGLVGDGRPRVWLGPTGTITPTHYDQSSAWQVVVLGRKRVWLASPLESSLVDSSVGLYNDVDPRRADGDDTVHWVSVELDPSDAVFVPVGWWHQVEALEPSLSVSFSGFQWPNAHPWYRPAA